jgi:hypothetical protein
LFYGASQLGKTTAILQAFYDRTGVVYVSFLEQKESAFAGLFATAFGYYGENQGNLEEDLSLKLFQGGTATIEEVFKAFEAAAKYRAEKHLPKIVVIIDDIHRDLYATARSIFGTILNLYTQSYVSVIFIASDYQGVEELREGTNSQFA